VLAPLGIGLFAAAGDKNKADSKTVKVKDKVLSHFGRRYVIMKTRKRVTADGGASVLVIDS